MKYLITIFGLFFFSLILQAAPDYSKQGELPVEVLEFRDLRDTTAPSKGRQVPIKIHLPISGGPYPVVIISHGAGGNWDTHYAQANHLASHGYAVFCLEHVGSNTERLKKGIRIFHNLEKMIHDSREVLRRPRDVTFAINQASQWNYNPGKLYRRLDLFHMGMMGHSFGATTTMVIGGMRPALDWLEPKVAPGSGLGPNLMDNRVKCGVVLSPPPPGDPFFLMTSYRYLEIPLMGISGSKDKSLNGQPPEDRFESFKLWPDPQNKNVFVWLQNASHLDFTDSTGGDQHGRESSSRSDVQPIVRAATLLYFNQCLKPSVPGNITFTAETLKRYLQGQITNVEVRRN